MSSRDPLQELEDALSFTTSPDFAARVRQQVATRPVRSRFFGAQGLALAAAVVVATTIGVVAIYRSRLEVEQVSRPIAVDATAHTSYVARAGLEARGRGLETQAALRVRHTRATNGSTANRSGSPFETPFRTLVPDDQRRALDNLLAAMREGRATVPATVVDEELNDNGQRVPRALVIEPMKLELLVKDPIK